jgi:RimJ/RimL family protein N-acetyltransferase
VTDATSLAGTHRRTAERVAQFRRRLFEVVPIDVIEREVDKQLPKLNPIPGAEIRRVTPTQPAGWRELLPKSHWRTVEGFLARGDHGYLATIDGTFAGRIWVSRVSHRDPWSGLHIRLAPDEAYTYAMLVEVPYRRLGVAAAVVAAMLSDLREERTAKRVYGWVDSRNRESQALLRIVFGFTQVQTVKRLHLPRLGWQVPGSDKPRFGPVSRVGHHSEPIRP